MRPQAILALFLILNVIVMAATTTCALELTPQQLDTLKSKASTPVGQHTVGMLLLTGKVDQFTTTPDKAEGIKWLTMAAEQGYADSEYALGVAYACGDGVEKDMAKAISYYESAAQHGSPDANAAMGVRYATGEGVVQDDCKAVGYFREAAGENLPKGLWGLGLCKLNGMCVTKDIAEARQLIGIAANRLYTPAMVDMARMAHAGIGTDCNDAEALMWLGKASAHGNREATDIIKYHQERGDLKGLRMEYTFRVDNVTPY